MVYKNHNTYCNINTFGLSYKHKKYKQFKNEVKK